MEKKERTARIIGAADSPAGHTANVAGVNQTGNKIGTKMTTSISILCIHQRLQSSFATKNKDKQLIGYRKI